MKNFAAKLAAACLLSLTFPFGAAFADDLAAGNSALASDSALQTAASDTIECNVLDYGAVPNDAASDAGQINAALAEARKNPGKKVQVTVPSGVYHLGVPLRIYSNTTLTLAKDARIVADYGNQEMLNGLHIDPATGDTCQGKNCKHGGYTQLSNITIEGGTWEGMQGSKTKKVGNMSIFMLRHANNTTIRNTTVKYAATHFFNLSSSQNVLVENVTFKDAQEVTDPKASFWGEKGIKYGDMNSFNAVEAVHLDTCDGVGESGAGAYPLDCTPCNKVTVQKCTFDNVWAGVGNHHPAKKADKRSSDIKVLNNTFKNLRYYPFYAINFDKVTLKGNKITNAAGITGLRACTGCDVMNNTFSAAKSKVGKFDPKVSSMTLPSLWITSAKNFKIQKNTVNASKYRALVLSDSVNVNVTSNKFPNAAEKAIRITGTTKCNVKSNIIKSAKDFGIQVDGSKSIVLESNTISFTKECGIRVSNSTATISKNKVAASKTRGIQASDSTVTISNNTVRKSKDVGVRVTGGKATIKSNKILESGPKAVHVDSNTKNLKIVNNTVDKTTQHGIMIRDCDGASISKNTVSAIPERGIAVHDSLKVQVVGNKVTSEGDAMYVAGESDRNYCSANIKSNTFSSSDLHDLKLGYFAYRCRVVGNTLVHGSFATSEYSSYSGDI